MMTTSKISAQAKIIDLHTHTIYSDGSFTPKDLIEKAVKSSLSAIAISDHEHTGGIEEAIDAAKKYNIEVVPAVEISTYPDSLTEHHILGYFIDYKNTKLQNILNEVRQSRENRARKVVENLNELGYQINFGDVKAMAQGTIVQPHLAMAVITDMENQVKLKKDFGTIPDTGAFIRKYLIPGAPAYESRKTLQPKEAIDLIHEIGGLAVFAHPCWTAMKKIDGNLKVEKDKFDFVVNLGVDGIEALAHRGSEDDTKESVELFTTLAHKNNLFITGGSDFHGLGSAGKDLGFTDFYLKVPYNLLETMKKLKYGK